MQINATDIKEKPVSDQENQLRQYQYDECSCCVVMLEPVIESVFRICI